MALSSSDAERRRFTRSVRGYAKGDVDAFQNDVVHALRALEERISITDAKREDAEQKLAKMQATIDEQVEDAARARREIIADARAEAGAMIASVRSLGDRVVIADAAEAAGAIVAGAEAKAKEILAGAERGRSEAEAQGAALRAVAERDAATTRAEAERVLDEARAQAKLLRAAAQSAADDADTITIDLRETEPSEPSVATSAGD